MNCKRCGKETKITKLGFLNMDEICLECDEKEKETPVYKYAKEIERAFVLKGDYNFPGVLENLVYNTDEEANLLARLKYGDSDKNIFDAWILLINSFQYNPAKFAELITKNNIDYKKESISWIAQMSILSPIDERNKASKEACEKIGIESAILTPLTKRMARSNPIIHQQYTATMLSIYTGKPIYLP